MRSQLLTARVARQPAAKPSTIEFKQGHVACAAPASEIPSLLMVPSTRVVEAIFSAEGTKVGFVVRGEILPVQAGALLQWGCANWRDDRSLARKWKVSYVIGAPDWLKRSAGEAQPPKGVRFAFL